MDQGVNAEIDRDMYPDRNVQGRQTMSSSTHWSVGWPLWRGSDSEICVHTVPGNALSGVAPRHTDNLMHVFRGLEVHGYHGAPLRGARLRRATLRLATLPTPTLMKAPLMMSRSDATKVAMGLSPWVRASKQTMRRVATPERPHHQRRRAPVTTCRRLIGLRTTSYY